MPTAQAMRRRLPSVCEPMRSSTGSFRSWRRSSMKRWHAQAAPPSGDATSRALGTYLAAHLPRIGEAAPRYARFAQRDAPSERLDAIEQRMLSKLRIAVDVLNRQFLDIENMLK